MHLKTLSNLLVFVATVAAHGYVDNVTINGILYTGYQSPLPKPDSDPYYATPPPRIIRPVQGNGPITDLTLIDLQCGGYTEGGIVGSKPANLTAGPVAAGSTVSLRWTLWPDSHSGPVITYMAKCPAAGCSNYLPGTDHRTHRQHDRLGRHPLKTAGNSYSYTIPSCLSAGSYIVRHEILALHAAWTYPGVQFYPSCHQIQVTGSGTSTGPSSKVAIPGVYKATDPGIVYDMYAVQTYTIPGPAVFSC
ncbi:putative glycoside hydrolase family 61 protein [Botrytis fragariae]|uniref:lytic cellulose monooxygenase (C4-dehydrogenating) n=1 Tax=Botrytis fragariae TaxID=1964551 RepID=A0A8H6AMD7_9HELO|nr:putative glycoside hydrolase family 61 protein [Botrytis fragariae]KAF5869998.1 putative glycoside hydrolase family 61 protein [Botrytis fragariae]